MKGRFLGVIAGLIFCQSTLALPSGGGDLIDQEPPDLSQEFDKFGTFADRGNMTLTMGSNFGTLTVDAVTRTGYLTTSNGIQEFSVNSALTTAGLNPSNYDFHSAFPGIDRNVMTIDPDGDWSKRQSPLRAMRFVTMLRKLGAR
jgi:hypothetical protein